MLDCLEGYTPSDFGFGPEFPEFRTDPRTGHPVQLEAVEFGAYCASRFAAMSVPTGVGKSLIAVTLTKLTGLRTCVLTATKGLMGQYDQWFEKYGLVTIKGRGNYQCGEFGELDCSGGSRMGCHYCNGRGCEYERRRDTAKKAAIVSTNYAYWMTINEHSSLNEGPDVIELLVLDEAHEADRLLSEHLAIRMYEKDLPPNVDSKRVGEEIEQWQEFAARMIPALDVVVAELLGELKFLGRHVKRQQVAKLEHLEKLRQKYERILDMRDDWVLEKREGTKWGRVWSFDVIWPGRYAESYLFCHVPKVVLMSATLRPKTMGLLGVRKEEFEFREWDRMFPANRHPIYHIPATDGDGKDIRVDRRTSHESMGVWVEHLDRIIDGRLDRKGLIQTVSYERQRFLLEHSRHAGIMLGNTADPESATAAEVAEEFRKAPLPRILVSPSFATGWDFPRSECEYVIICKIPFKPNQGKVAKAREERDKRYGAYLAMQEMVQSSGRAMRSETDQSEVFITDGHLGWFLYQNKDLAPSWFANAVRKVGKIPDPPKRLEGV